MSGYLTSRDFVLSALHTIATSPELDALHRSLVLKGSVALNLQFGSDRLSRSDMDFGLLTHGHRLTQADSDNLLAEMNADWSTRAEGNSRISVKGESCDTPWIRFTHPVTKDSGVIKIQTNGLQIPPVLSTEMSKRPFKTYDGKRFRFRVLQVSEIAGEKMCRLWRPDKHPPRTVDLYDIGFCLEQPDYERELAVRVVRAHRKGREKALIKIAEAHIAVRRSAKSPGINEARRFALFGPTTTDSEIAKRIAAGFTEMDSICRLLDAVGSSRADKGH